MKKFLNIDTKKLSKQFYVFIFVLLLSAGVLLSGCNLLNTIEKIFTPIPSASRAEKTRQEITSPPKNNGEVLYGYDNIKDTSAKNVYSALSAFVNGSLNDEKFFVEGSASAKAISQAVTAFQNDHPEVFWLDTNCYKYYESDGLTYIIPEFTMSDSDIISAKQQVDEKVENIISKIPSEYDELQKEIYIHDYLIDNCEYDYDALKSNDCKLTEHNVYGSIIEGKAVCEGYAQAFNLLCRKAGIDCTNILGRSENQEHIWNAVMIGGEWYQVDVTWDDNDRDNTDSVEVAGHMYLNINDEMMYRNHTLNRFFDEISDDAYESENSNLNTFVPKCSSMQYNFYTYYSARLDNLENADDIIYDIADAAKSREPFIYIKIDEGLDYDQTADKIINDGCLAGWIGSANKLNDYAPRIKQETTAYKLEDFRVVAVSITVDK